MLPSENCSPSDRSSPPGSNEGGFAPTPNPRSEPALSDGQRTTAGSLYPLLATQTPNPRSELLISYFRSGWAFLIPYLATYLLYAWLKLPVNPEGSVKEMSESAGALSPQLSTLNSQQFPFLRPPCLLHVYWLLHGLHLMLGAFTLRSWWRKSPLSTLNSQPTSNPQTAWHRLYAALPWLCLALLFWIPGIYLEWPSDPWEHLRRINEWHILDQITAHSSWKKSSYFLPYSLTGHTTGLSQLSWLNFYYTGICLLLSWQYSRLARAVGLGPRASFIFVLLQALLMGNNIFSFYRYYGLSSSILAQLGAVALARIALEALQLRDTQRGGTAYASPFFPFPVSNLLQLISAGILVLTLVAFNHIQGLGIAGLGVLAVIVWRLVEWKRSMILWLGSAAILASAATILWFPRHPALDEFYRPHGLLTAWYGFNLYAWGSIAFERSLQILGFFGVITLALGLWLVARKNHVVGWLSLMPPIALTLPCFALPFAHVVAANTSPGNIITFHRMLLAVPMGLALVAALCPKNVKAAATRQETSNWNLATGNRLPEVRSPRFLVSSLLILLALTVTPAVSSYNRFWHSIVNTPDDLKLIHFMTGWKPALPARTENTDILIVDTPLGHEIRQVFDLTNNASWERLRLIDNPAFIDSLDCRLRNLKAIIPLYDVTSLNTDSIQWAQLAFLRRTVTQHKVAAAPTSTDQAWITFGGAPPEHTFTEGRLTISNSIGNDSVIFNQDLIPISRYKRYHLTSSIRQTGNATATNLLAVAWYDQDMKLLQSRLPQPQGAGAPRGWNNGTYSYYGLVDQPATTTWAHYSISLGLGETASIPANASYLRIGALLNYRATPGAKVEITEVTLIENPIQSHLVLSAPGFWHLYTPASQAALLSGHWSAQYVPTAHAGTQELRSTAINF